MNDSRSTHPQLPPKRSRIALRVRAAHALLAAALACALAAGCSQQDALTEIQKLQAAGNFEATVEPLRELLAKDRSNAQVNYLYGLALVQTGQRGLAEWSLRKAMEDPEWRLPAGRLLAFGEMVAQNHDAAIATLSELIDAYPDDVELIMMRANVYAHQRLHLEEALADADRVFELDPENVEAFEPRILALLSLDRAEEAGEAIEELGKRIEETEGLDPELQGWHCATAALFAFESGETENAAERWEDCTERFPGHSNVVTNAIDYYDKRMEFPRSLEILRRAVEAKPKSRGFRINLAGRLRAGGETEEATALLRAPTESDDLRVAAGAWFDLAKHYQELGDDANATQAFEESIALVEQTGVQMAQMKLEYADSLLLGGEYDRALEVAETISVPAYREVIRARVAQERGDPAKALEHFEESFRLWPDNPWTRYYAAIAAEAVGDFDAAIESYRYSVRIAPGATDARQRLARLHLAEGKPQEAIYILRLRAEHDRLDLDGELLTFRVWGHLGNRKSIDAQLSRIPKESPRIRALALAAAAEGLRARSGPAAAELLIRQTPAIDLGHPDFAEALRELVRASSEAGTGGATRELRAARAAYRDSPVLLEIEGLRAELQGDAAAARAAYEQVLARTPRAVGSLTGLCRVSPEADAGAVVAACERALEASPGDPQATLVGAKAMRRQGRSQDAVRLLERGLAAHPYDAGLATELAVALSGDPADEQRVESLRARATRFSRSGGRAVAGRSAPPSG